MSRTLLGRGPSGRALGLAAVAACAVLGCRRAGPPRAEGVGPVDPGIFTDELGRQVRPRTVPARRVVSLAPNLTELLFALGAGPQVVGIDNYSDQPTAALRGIPRLGSNYEPSIEKLVSLSPDVVFTALSANRRETAEALTRLGVPVYVTDTRSIRDLDRTFLGLGAITGHAGEAREQLRRLHGGLEAVARRVAGRPRPRVLIVVWNEPLYVAGHPTFTDDLIEVAGGLNVVTDASGFARYPLESVLKLAPEVIVLPTHSAVEQGPGAAGYWARWSELPAVRDGRVIAVDDSVIIRPGPRLVEGAELLARIIHPGAPPGPPDP